MHRQGLNSQIVACHLAGVAGFVDAAGFMSVGGFFVSFMSGNTTRLAVGIGGRSSAIIIPAALIAAFLIGVISGTLLARAAAARRSGMRAPSLLFYVALLLVAAGFGTEHDLLPALAAALAMGALNALFERDGEVRIGLTYMTGTLVRAGQHMANAMTGGPRLAWMPWLFLWLSLASGAVLGALTWPHFGWHAFWAAALAVVLIAPFSRADL